MHEVLIALQNNLASRIALRYAKQLETSDRFNMQAIHIPEIKAAGPAPGSGWVKEKWEDALIRESTEEISDLVRNEYLFHFSDSALKSVSGPEDQVILGELEEKPYDFFIEGQLHAFDPDVFTARLSSRLYQDAACPILMVKNMVAPDRGTLVLSTPEDLIPRASGWLNRLLSGLSGPLDMLSCRFETRPAKEEAQGEMPANITGPKNAADETLPWQGIQRVFSGRGTPEELAEWAGQYAMVVSSLPRPKNPLTRMLAAIPTAVLLCPSEKSGTPIQDSKGKKI